jgi:hypothetical protein
MNEWPKAVTTSSIWIAVGFSLGFGLFKMNFSGDPATVFILPLILTVIIIGGATMATRIVWQSRQPNNDGDVEK